MQMVVVACINVSIMQINLKVETGEYNNRNNMWEQYSWKREEAEKA